MRDDDAVVALDGADRRVDDAGDHHPGVELAGLEPGLDLVRMVGPVGERDLVVGRVDPLDAGGYLGRQIEKSPRIEQFGLDPADQLDLRARPQALDLGDVCRQVVRRDADMVDAGELSQTEALGLGDVLGDRVLAVGEGRVNVHVLQQRRCRRCVHSGATAAVPAWVRRSVSAAASRIASISANGM